jgi:hypothetical protein
MREQSVREKKLRLAKETLRRLTPQASKLKIYPTTSWPECTSWDPNCKTDPRQ